MTKMTFRALCVTALLASACAQIEEKTYFEGGKEVSAAYATKVVNSEDKADTGSLLVVLDEKTADLLSYGGSEPLLAEACESVDVKNIERLFVSNTALARQKGLHKWYLITFNGDRNPAEMAEVFAALSCVEHVQFNTLVYREFENEGTPYNYAPKAYGEFNLPYNDPLLPDQWHYINNVDISVAETSRAGADINVKNAWKLCSGDPNIVVAVCDEGVKYTHPDLAPNMWVNEDEIPGNGIDDDNNGYVDDIHGWNFLSTTDYPKVISWAAPGDGGHGTHVAGTVAAVNNNGIGVGGVAGGTGNGDGVRIMSCQVFSGNSSATVAARAKAYEYAANNGACILQCSFGLSGGMVTSDGAFELSYGVEKVGLDYFFNHRQVYSPVDKNFVIFASGNDGYHLSGYPAAHREYIAVSAIGPDYLPAYYTNYGPGTNISAPGGDSSINMTVESNRAQILSTVPSDCEMYDTDYGYMQGTSMACPHVSGVVALALSYARRMGKEYTYDDFLAMIYTSVNDLEYYIETCSKVSNGIELDLSKYWQKMGTGAIDTWRLFMQIEGTPSLVAKTGETAKLSLNEYMGGAAAKLTYLGVEADQDAYEALGLEESPFVKNGKLNIRCTKNGSAKIVIRAIAGGDVLGTEGVMGGTEFKKEISVLSRESGMAKNGGWL